MTTTPCITMHQPWASWVALGWKTIESRTHQRFGSLMNRRIGIHAGLHYDPLAIDIAAEWLTEEQRRLTTERLQPDPDGRRVQGAIGRIVCTARVVAHVRLGSEHEPAALIHCDTVLRYGLVLADIRMLNIPAKGKQGIWYFDIDDRMQGVAQCRKCGCTEEQACVSGQAEPCHWAEPDLCSYCVEKA